MAGTQDPLTDLPPPSRLDPDDLSSFAFHPSSSCPPFMAWSRSASCLLHNSSKLPTRLLLLASSAAACHLLHHLPNKSLIASLILPEITLSTNSLLPSPLDFACYLYSLDHHASVVLVSIQYPVPPERAHAWVKLLFDSIHPENVLMLSSLHSDHFRSKLSADDQLLFRLETDRQRLTAEESKCTVPYFPSGSLVDGIAAAVLSWCQIRGLRGRLLLSWPDGEPSALSILVSALRPILQNYPGLPVMDFALASKAPFKKKRSSDSQLYF